MWSHNAFLFFVLNAASSLLAAPTTESSPVAAPIIETVATSGRIERNFVLSNDLVTLNILGDTNSKLLTVEMTYAGLAWISFAVSTSGQMTDSTAIIGLASDSAPFKYDITGRSLGSVTRAPDGRQVTLTDTEFQQNATHTFMKFTKPFVEDGDISVLMDGSDNFLYAYGSGNSLAVLRST